jgi:hypothetical protein
MDLHRLAEERSLAYHRAVAARLACEPRILDRARVRLAAWATAGRSAHHARRWQEILARPIDEITRFLAADSDEARELRQATPFAGALDARERWRLWREVRQRHEARR